MTTGALEVVKRVRGGLPASHDLLFEAWTLLEDAALALDAGAHYSASAGVRAAVEAGGYLFVTRIPTAAPGFHRQPRPSMDFEQIKLELKRLGALDSRLQKAVGRIQEDGNFMVHLGVKMDKALLKHLKTTPSARAGGMVPVSSLMGPSPAKVRSNLNDALDILVALSAKL